MSSTEEMAAIKLAKRELRTTIREVLSKVSVESINKQSSLVHEAVISMPEWKAAERVGIYLSMSSGEINTTSLLRSAFEEKKIVHVPATYPNHIFPSQPLTQDAPSMVMEMLELHSMQDFETLEKDKWGIPTPNLHGRPYRRSVFGLTGATIDRNLGDPRGLDVLIMPGMAFDSKMGRLGHGKGFYDYFLARYEWKYSRKHRGKPRHTPFLVGLALQEQILEEGETVPRDDRDWTLDALARGDGSMLRHATTVKDAADDHDLMDAV